jgi:hypothetical protein
MEMSSDIDRREQVVALYTDLLGRERLAPTEGFVYLHPGAEMPFLFASNTSVFGLHVQDLSGAVHIGNPLDGRPIIRCLQHPPLGRICFEQQQLGERNLLPT